MRAKFIFLLVLSISATGCTAYNFSTIKRSLGVPGYDGCYIASVPFERQAKYQCGPAALSSVMRYWGEEVSQEQISRALYVSRLKGTLDFDLENYPKGYGLFVRGYSGTPEELKSKLKKGIPLIVSYGQGPRILGRYHYSVVVGFDGQRGLLIAHTGQEENAVIPMREFLRRWAATQNWTLLVAAPEKVNWQLSAAEHNSLGLAYERRGDWLRAGENYEAAIRLEPEVAAFYFNRGNADLKLHRFGKAEGAYKKAIEINPAFADAYNNLACAYLEQGTNLSEAKRLAGRARELNPAGEAYYMDTLAAINEVLEGE